ncbi:MAG: isoprenylcysteine carboxylmethyltransferase family protein [Acidobacteria bacterium]|nr:isoprenylcysteine carboxylmethyltransferase family protein [Acidobacteriota bacterium]
MTFRSAVAWSGGVAFLLSLGYSVYFYLVALGVPSLTHRDWAYAFGIDAALFSGFALHHSIMARSGAKALVARLIPPDLERSIYVWIASVLFFLTCWLWQPIGGLVYRHTGVGRLPHLAIQIAGLWVIARAARLLDPLDLAGIRQIRPAGRRHTPPISRHGPYGFVRHPIYLGWLLVTFGVATMTVDRLVFAMISAIYLMAAIPFEEGSLREAFGDEYVRYCRQVRWRLFPGIW